ncbi:MAG: hypothetical protein GY780_00140 [bacterium]|nr:hypothetical protein [bacterium]
MRKLIILLFLILISLPAAAKDLDSKITRRIDTIATNLDQVDQNLDANNLKEAKSYLKTATDEMGRIMSWYKGKFDENHPDFVAIDQRLKATTAKVESSAPAAAEAKPVAKPKSTGGANKPLNNKVARRIEAISNSLDQVDSNIGLQDLKEAKTSLESAKKEMAKIMDWYKGKFDENHPDFVAIERRLAASIDSIEGDSGMGAQAAGMKKDLEIVIGSLMAAKDDIYATLDEVRLLDSRFSSAVSNTERKGNPERVLSAISDMRASVERGQIIYAEALQTASDFRQQFKSLETLRNLVSNGGDAIYALERIESFDSSWNNIRAYPLGQYLGEAHSMMNTSSKAIERGEKNHDFLGPAISAGEENLITADWVQQYSSALLGTAEQTSDEMKAFAESNKKLETELGTLMVAVAKAKGVESDARHLKLSGARFPEATHSGGKWNAVEKTMTQVFEEDAKDKTVKRVAVNSPWEERTEARWINDRWVVGTYLYVGGTLLAELPDGRFRVYRVTFRRTQQDNGEFGPLAVWSFGHSFEILAENINL